MWPIIVPEHSLVHISAGMAQYFSYFVINRPLLNCSFRKQPGMPMRLTLGVSILYSKSEIQLVLSSQCNVGAPVWSNKAYMYIRITLFFLTSLYMNIIYP